MVLHRTLALSIDTSTVVDPNMVVDPNTVVDPSTVVDPNMVVDPSTVVVRVTSWVHSMAILGMVRSMALTSRRLCSYSFRDQSHRANKADLLFSLLLHPAFSTFRMNPIVDNTG